MPRTTRTRLAPYLAALALTAVFAYRFGPLLANSSDHFVDFAKLHGDRLLFEVPDTRLNSWILAWVDHAVWETPAALYHPNIHHPERNVLTGSEHLLGVALQLLPFEPFVDEAITRHQLAIALSSALLAATSFAAVHWACGSIWAAALAAAFALGMPWRVTELSHLQLISVQFVPLVWVGVTRCLLGDSSTRSLVVLGAAIGLTLLSSFYLAYFLAFSCAVLAAVVAWKHTLRWRDVLRLALAAAPGCVLFVLSALPYLARRAGGQLRTQYDPSLAISPSQVLAAVAPHWPHGQPETETLLNLPANYWTPWAVAVLAAIAGLHALRPGQDPNDSSPPRTFILGLSAIVLFGGLMMLGGSIDIAGTTWPTPARLFYEIVPGFELLRGPTRWGILIGTALPLLAGLGADTVDRYLRRRVSARVVLTLASAVTFAWFPIPTKPAWDNSQTLDLRYAAVRDLPPGPLLELPWPSDAGDIEFGSRSMLASTRHWRPLLNGYTGHRPRSYRFLLHIAERLPAKRSLEQLQRLTGLRFILLDRSKIKRARLASWRVVESAGIVRRVHDSIHTRIYEIVPNGAASDLLPVLVDPTRRIRTFEGLARRPLDAPAGELSMTTSKQHVHDKLNPARVRILNADKQHWPGFDIDPEGLVQLRYSYTPRGAPAEAAQGTDTRLVTLDADLAPGTTTLTVRLQAPRRSGTYDLCIDLVQQVSGQTHALPIPAMTRAVRVRGIEYQDDLTQLIERYLLAADAIPPCGSDH